MRYIAIKIVLDPALGLSSNMMPIFSPAVCRHNSSNSHILKTMNSQPKNPQAVVHNINNTNGNNYVNNAITYTTPGARQSVLKSMQKVKIKLALHVTYP